MTTPKLLLVLQFSKNDFDEAINLARLICEIEENPRSDVEFCVLHTRYVARFTVEAVTEILSRRFSNVMSIKCKRFGRGWPQGCNDLWQDGMIQIASLSRRGRIKSTGALTFEPDCCPLSPDWINMLISEWEAASGAGKIAVGSLVTQPTPHLNGNGIFHCRITDRLPQLQTSHGSWDTQHGEALLGAGQPTGLIIQKYGDRSIVDIEWLKSMTESGAALLHGVKHGSAKDGIRKFMQEGSFKKSKPKSSKPVT